MDAYARSVLFSLLVKRGGVGGTPDIFSAKSLHEFLNENLSNRCDFSIYMVRKFLKQWRAAGAVTRVGNVYLWTKDAFVLAGGK